MLLAHDFTGELVLFRGHLVFLRELIVPYHQNLPSTFHDFVKASLEALIYSSTPGDNFIGPIEVFNSALQRPTRWRRMCDIQYIASLKRNFDNF